MLLKDIKMLTQEARVHPNIQHHLEKHGYRYLDAGVDQQAYLAPDGSVLKIFGQDADTEESHRMFETWHDFCVKNKHTHLVPQFLKYSKFRSDDDGKVYLQIKMERLFPLPHRMGPAFEEAAAEAMSYSLKDFLEYLADETDRYDFSHADADERAEFLGMIDDAEEFWNIIRSLQNIAYRNAWEMDLHEGNAMMDEHGKIVIVDPWINPEG